MKLYSPSQTDPLPRYRLEHAGKPVAQAYEIETLDDLAHRIGLSDYEVIDNFKDYEPVEQTDLTE